MEQLIYSFCTSSSLQIPFFIRIASIEGSSEPPSFSELFLNPSLRNIAGNTKYSCGLTLLTLLVPCLKFMPRYRFGPTANHLRSLYAQTINLSNHMDDRICQSIQSVN